ncbi:HPr kinase/phosphorylase [Methylophaga thiooxydans]|uniref:HPr kinase/phosphorylase n=1 Tax=Methylophaga thiooxydans TaxID=392484 RepID=A0A0A0BDI4_9GAMM|nr:serine kinase [Methylophaga thiooxydans]KGM05920.1 HPr kinase/phosphorylase [Methylophaga thiooxydans]
MPDKQQTESRHGVMVCINGHGVLITGTAGIGKSSLALELLMQGHQLVADDVVELTRTERNLTASSPSMLKGLLHTRELGTINVQQQFGQHAVLDSSPVHYQLKLSATLSGNTTLEANYADATILQKPIQTLCLSMMNPASISSRLLVWLDLQQTTNNGKQTLMRRQQQQMSQ